MMCGVEGCDRERGLRRGWCELHYRRWIRTGQFEPRRNSGLKTTDQRFWPNVDRSSDSGCWLWIAGANSKGYGTATTAGGRRVYAHRLSWEMHHGAIPDEMVVDHLCHVRRCVNPDHLRLITSKQNNEHRKGASRISQTGVRGVYPGRTPGRYVAQAAHRHVGTFDSIEEAAAAVRSARQLLMTHSD